MNWPRERYIRDLYLGVIILYGLIHASLTFSFFFFLFYNLLICVGM